MRLVLALDAADYALARRWNCTNILQESHRQLEPHAWKNDFPITIEMWPLLATGAEPDTGQEDQFRGRPRYSSSVLELGRTAADVVLPASVQRRLGQVAVRMADHESDWTTRDDHPFDDVGFWPNVAPAPHLDELWPFLDEIEAGEHDHATVWNHLHGHFFDRVGWALRQEGPVVGVHTHILDIAGHAYAHDEETLRRYYESVDDVVGFLRNAVDELVILSDHGMEVSFLDGDLGGRRAEHSWRALISASWDADLPADSRDVAGWLEGLPQVGHTGEAVESAVDHAQLVDLGYKEA